MPKLESETPNGKDRRSGKNRRKDERRAEHKTEAGVLTTRKGERRSGGRRSSDPKGSGKK